MIALLYTFADVCQGIGELLVIEWQLMAGVSLCEMEEVMAWILKGNL